MNGESLPRLKNADILRLLRTGDGSEGLKLAWERYAWSVRGSLRKMGCPDNDADEAQIDVFRALLAGRMRYESTNLRGLLVTLSRYVALGYARDEARRRRGNQRALNGWHTEKIPRPDEALVLAELAVLVRDGQWLLDDEDAFIYDAWDSGECDAAIGARFSAEFGWTANAQAIKSRRVRIRQHLVQFLHERGYPI